jgi:hypothetical protein
VENSERSRLLAFFNTLQEEDKDLVIAMAESLVEKYTANIQDGNCITEK